MEMILMAGNFFFRRSPFVAGLLAGLASLPMLSAEPTPIRPPFRSATEALRSDWLRIGADLQRVISRENARLEKSQE